MDMHPKARKGRFQEIKKSKQSMQFSGLSIQLKWADRGGRITDLIRPGKLIGKEGLQPGGSFRWISEPSLYIAH
jgi:hypothetical protein